jgi:hypothetical protein
VCGHLGPMAKLVDLASQRCLLFVSSRVASNDLPASARPMEVQRRLGHLGVETFRNAIYISDDLDKTRCAA